MPPQAKQLGYTSGSNGNGVWRKAIDGTIRQSGEVTLASGAVTITFPVPFPVACEFVGLTAVTGSSTITDVSVYLTAEPGLASASIGGSVATLGLGGALAAGTFKVRWWAIGS